MPNPSLQPTCYGLRPPHAAELKRYAAMTMIGSFIIEFPVHLKMVRREFSRNMIQADGGIVVELGPNTWRIDCENPRILNDVSWVLLNSVVAKHCRVVETAGAAENRAGAYVYPAKRDWRRK